MWQADDQSTQTEKVVKMVKGVTASLVNNAENVIRHKC